MKRVLSWHHVPFMLCAPFMAGCVNAPEHCHGCLALLLDGGGAFDTAIVDSGAGAGGIGGTVIGVGTGGVIGTGGTETGGATGSGGQNGSGGMSGTGGGATGGRIGTGGVGTGGMGTAGAGTGGRGTGGTGTGGTGTGGVGGTGGVVATGGTGIGGAAAGGAGGDADLVLWYKFDEASGLTAADAAMFGGTARNGTLGTAGGGTASFSSTHQVGTHAVNLVGTSATVGGYVTVPSLQALAPGAVTISTWVNLTASSAAQNWERVFDFGISETVFMFLTARTADSPNAVGFGISTTGSGTTEQRINGAAALSTGAWHHVVVVLAAGTTYTGRLYVDNVQVGSNAAMTLHPGDLGATTTNRLGRSQFAEDPYFNGYIDDFRVYKRALTAAEISMLYGLR